MTEIEENRKRIAELRKVPELIPLTNEQKEAFMHFWRAAKTYERRRDLIGAIPNLYGNRLRYRDECLKNEDDIRMFNAALRDCETMF